MKKWIVAVCVILAGVSFAKEDKVKLQDIKDKQMIKCLADYIKNNKTHITMIINEKGEKELHIPKKYVNECKRKLNK